MSAIQSDAERLAIHREIETEGERTPAQAITSEQMHKLLDNPEFERLWQDMLAKKQALTSAKDRYEEAALRVIRAQQMVL